VNNGPHGFPDLSIMGLLQGFPMALNPNTTMGSTSDTPTAATLPVFLVAA